MIRNGTAFPKIIVDDWEHRPVDNREIMYKKYKPFDKSSKGGIEDE